MFVLEVAAAFQKVVDHFGDLNVVVNNAGVAPTTPLDTITEEQFERTFAINVGGVIWGAQAAQAQFKALGHGGKWAVFVVVGQCVIAWIAAFVVYQVGHLFI